MEIEICSQCHPFYTGKKKVLDITGRVDRFKKLTEKATAKKEAARKSKTKKTKKAAAAKKDKAKKTNKKK